MRTTIVTNTALFFLVAAACSQRGQTKGETIEALTPGATTPVAPTPPASVTPPGNVTPTAVTPTSTTPSTGQTPSPTPTSAEPDGTGSDGAKASSGSSGEVSEECIPPEPVVVPCTDDLNTDEPQTPCSQWVEWGTCDESWMLERHVCDRSCGRCTEDMVVQPAYSCEPQSSGTSTPPPPTPPVMNQGPKLPPIEGGEAGFTTRYWDCCKPHCGWPGNASNPVSSCDINNNDMGGNHDASSACQGGPAHMCWNFVPITNGDNIAYAFAAHNGVGCGTCFQLDFTGESKNPKPETGHDFGSQSLKGKSMIVQVINTGGIEAGQFDLLVPGGGVGEFNACSSQWGGADLGETYGGFFLACQKEHDFEYEPARQCARDWCDRVFSDKPDLHKGCSWFVEWFALADNPTMHYKQVECPPELKQVSGL